jgi:hypothetical protein
MVLAKMVFIPHLHGLPSLLRTAEKESGSIITAMQDAKKPWNGSLQTPYTQLRGLARVTNRVKLKLAAMNLKKLAKWKWRGVLPACCCLYCLQSIQNPVCASSGDRVFRQAEPRRNPAELFWLRGKVGKFEKIRNFFTQPYVIL